MYGCILTVGKRLIAQTEEGLASYRRPKAQRFGSWCTVASFKLARVSSCRQRKGLDRINAHELTYLVEGLSSSLLVGKVSPTEKRKGSAQNDAHNINIFLIVSIPASQHQSALKLLEPVDIHDLVNVVYVITPQCAARSMKSDLVDPYELAHAAGFLARSTAR